MQCVQVQHAALNGSRAVVRKSSSGLVARGESYAESYHDRTAAFAGMPTRIFRKEQVVSGAGYSKVAQAARNGVLAFAKRALTEAEPRHFWCCPGGRRDRVGCSNGEGSAGHDAFAVSCGIVGSLG